MHTLVIQSRQKIIQPREDAAKSFDEVGEHPWQISKRELPLRPWRALEFVGVSAHAALPYL